MPDLRRKRRQRHHAMPVEEYRVPPGHVALTFDLEGYAPSTISIEASRLTDIVDEVDKRICAGWSYQKTLSILADIFRACKKGRPQAESGLLLGYWVALNHPDSGAEMRRLIANRMANDEPVHITLFGARKQGIALALGERFIDLAAPLQAAKVAGVGVGMWKGDHPERDGRVQ